MRRREQLHLPWRIDDCEARLLDLQKAYPRVSKPVRWNILECHGMQGPFLICLKDLYESTCYAVKSKEGESEQWILERVLRKGCPTSPVLFNVFEVVMRLAERNRKAQVEKNGHLIEIKWNWLPGTKIPSSHRI